MHVGVGPEHVLGAVPVVRVPVDDEHPVAPGAQLGRGDRDVVDQAEAHRVGRFGVMAGRPDRAERGGARAGFERLDGRQAGSGGEERRVPGSRRSRGVGVERATTPGAERLELVEVLRRVDPLQFGPRRPPGGELAHRLVEPGRRQPGEDGLQPGRTLGVPAAGIVLGQARIGRHQEHRRRVASPVARPFASLRFRFS